MALAMPLMLPEDVKTPAPISGPRVEISEGELSAQLSRCLDLKNPSWPDESDTAALW